MRPNTIPKAFLALGRKPKSQGDRGMNKTEREWSVMLEARRVAGELLYWSYEPIKVRMADNTFYTPDFLVVLASGAMELHEVKGAFVMDDARLKFKLVAEHFPAALVWAQKVKGGAWKVEVAVE
jgi:hypothetical protein